MTTADVVVAGAGHNSLITAAYLAAAGYEVVVLDARAIPGGGAASEELLGPGYQIDSCSTGHTLIQTNPLLLDDELGLLGDYGVEYLVPDPFAHVAFPDGRQLTMWMDVERSYEEIARFSRADADAYRRMLADYDEVKGVFGAATFTPPGFGPSLDQRLAEHPKGRIWQRKRMMSAWDVIRHEFESDHVRAFLLWQAFQTLVLGRQRRSWTLPRGGSGALTDSLVRFIEDRGGTVLCDRPVGRLVIENDRCAGVETEAGERFLAREAVVSTIHVKHLLDMAPAESWDEDFRYGVETFDVGFSGFAVYMGTTEAPVFETEDGPRSAVSAGLAGWPEQVIEHQRALRDGRYLDDVAWLLVATPTLVDPSRAPRGRHTVKFLSAQPWLEGDRWEELKERQAHRQLERVRRFCPDFTEDAILAMLVKSPLDIEAQNRHMIRGTFHGGDRTVAQSGPLRPAPGWGQYRMPIPGLYQTGGPRAGSHR
jgi:phytoene dehydrogenase-like protein